MFCENGEVSDGLIPEFLNSSNLSVSGLYNQNCSYQLFQTINEHVITGSSGFRFLSSPVSGKVYADLLEELWIKELKGLTYQNQVQIWTYNNGWNVVEDLNNQILNPGKGILIYVFSDTDYDGDDDLPVTISVNEDSALQKFNNNWNNFSLGSEVSSRGGIYWGTLTD